MSQYVFLRVMALLCFSLPLFLSACAEEKVAPLPAPLAEVSPEVNPREPVFVYRQTGKMPSSDVTLKLNSEPLRLADSYVRLLGVVSGRRPLALIDGGGKGFIVEIGDELFGYSVIGIGRKEVILKKHV